MYYKLQGYAADPHLKPEEMQAVEAGTQFCNDFLDAKVTFFYHHGRNMIDWIKDTSKGESAVWESVNHTRINVYGLDVYTSINLRFLFPSQQLMRTFSINYGYLSQDKELEPFMVSQYTLEYLRHKMVARLSLSPYSRLTLDACLRWQDRTGHYTDLDGKVADYRPYALLDARLQWQAKGYQLYAQANNLLDNRNYTDFGNVPQPGAWFTAGILICIK
jgi:iron complex outermembrane receptor protein